jgi:hypothetical protein
LNNSSEQHKYRDAIHKYLQKTLTTKESHRFITERSGSKVGLGKIIASYNPKTRKVTIDMDGITLSSNFRNKLEQELTELYDKNNPNHK